MKMLRRTHLWLLALALATAGLGAFLYKWQVLLFPLQPVAEAEVWNIEARVGFRARGGTNKVTLQIPSSTPGFAVLDERFLARGYGMIVEPTRDGNRQVQWTIRRAAGPQALYYRATVFRDRAQEEDGGRPVIGPPAQLEEPYQTAMDTLLEEVRDHSADIASFARELVRRFNVDTPSTEVQLLRELYRTEAERMAFMVQMLAVRQIAGRVLWGLELTGSTSNATLVPYLQVHNQRRWVTINPRTAAQGWPDNFFVWNRGDLPQMVVEDNPRATLNFSVQRNTADALAVAEQRAEVLDAPLVRWSLLSLPIQAQATYAILLMVPVGAFIMLVLRNIVGVKTFGTFMPVLIALAFRETQLLAGIALFVVVVGMGLLVRFYLEKLKLLLVPRLTAVLIVVMMLMAFVSILSHRLGIEIGLSVALFPIVIMAMTIERMSIVWEERGASTAMKEGLGSLLVACLAYLVMNWPPLVHLVFVFPELLLVLLAATLLVGRYSGYRLTELFRFRALARKVEAARAG